MKRSNGFSVLQIAQGSGKAKFRLGDCFESGSGVERDREKARTLREESIPLLEAEASQQEGDSDAESMYLLHLAHHFGLGVQEDKDFETSLHWLQRAAERNHGNAQWNLGECYFGLLGLQMNQKVGVQWLQKAAQNEIVGAQYKLARCYYHGWGVAKQDWTQALYWYEHAAEKGESRARRLLNDLKREIAAKRSYFERCVKESLLLKICNNNNSTTSPFPSFLGLWARGLARLSNRRYQPAGFAPTFLALKELVQHPNFVLQLQQYQQQVKRRSSKAINVNSKTSVVNDES